MVGLSGPSVGCAYPCDRVIPEHAGALAPPPYPFCSTGGAAAGRPPEQIEALLQAVFDGARPQLAASVALRRRGGRRRVPRSARSSPRPPSSSAPTSRPPRSTRSATGGRLGPAWIVVAAHVDPTAKLPVWEQVASASVGLRDRLGLLTSSASGRSGRAHRCTRASPSTTTPSTISRGSSVGSTSATPATAGRSSERPPVDLGPLARTLDVDGTPLPFERLQLVLWTS